MSVICRIGRRPVLTSDWSLRPQQRFGPVGLGAICEDRVKSGFATRRGLDMDPRADHHSLHG